jgi:hypothetical protein
VECTLKKGKNERNKMLERKTKGETKKTREKWNGDKSPSKPGMQVHKPWCLPSSNWVGLGNRAGGTAIFEKGP